MIPGDCVYILGDVDVPAVVISAGDGYVKVAIEEPTGTRLQVLEQSRCMAQKAYTRAVLSCVVAARIAIARSRRTILNLNPLELQRALEESGLSCGTAWQCVLLFDGVEWSRASLPMTLWLKRIRNHFFVAPAADAGRIAA